VVMFESVMSRAVMSRAVMSRAVTSETAVTTATFARVLRALARGGVAARALLVTVLGASLANAVENDAANELRYELRATREETRRATLAAHPDADASITGLLEYRLDGDFPPTEEDRYYRILRLPLPAGVQLEPGAIECLADGRVAVATRIGDVFLVSNAFEEPPYRAEFRRFASGLHEVLGLAQRDGCLYVTQRGEVTRLRDVDGDDRADRFDVVSDGWEISGDYHEYAFGSEFDRDGHIWVVLCLTGSFSSQVPFRGWCVKVSEDGVMTPVASGIRSPGGIGPNAAGDMFYTDNQGPWNGTSILRHLAPGAFMGHPDGNRWYDLAPNMGPRPRDPKSGGRWHEELAKIPELMNPAVFFPYQKMGQSASGVCCDRSDGRFGPFREQLFVGDQTHSTVMRVFLEKVKGRYQGACFPFRKGFGSGIVPIEQAPDGSLFAGGTARGWGARGGQPFSLERLVWTGKVPFEVHEMRVRPDGFELSFTEAVDPAIAADPSTYRLGTYTYIYQANYGSPEVDHTTPAIRAATVAADGRTVRLHVDGLEIGHVHELAMPALRSTARAPLVHPIAYYTLFYLPAE